MTTSSFATSQANTDWKGAPYQFADTLPVGPTLDVTSV
jgi:hypothetical protein